MQQPLVRPLYSAVNIKEACGVAQGLWQRGKAAGPGRYKWTNGNEYDGEWQSGRMHGQGTLKWLSGAIAAAQ